MVGAKTPGAIIAPGVKEKQASRSSRGLVQVILEAAAAAGMAEFAERLGFNLSDALTGDLELAANFFQGAAPAIVEAEAQAQNFLLADGQRAERVLHLLLEDLVAGGLGIGRASWRGRV